MANSDKLTRVVIVEDDEQIRHSLAELLSEDAGLELCASVEGYHSGASALLTEKPDVLLVDLGLPDGSGIDLIRLIETHDLTTQAIVISGFHDEHHVFKALEAGAKGYVLKHDAGGKIIEGIQLLLDGGAPISPVIARLMLQRFQSSVNADKPTVEIETPLTERQIKILTLVNQGYSSKEIAAKLNISYHTVTTHVKNIYRKLEVNNRMSALKRAQGLGLTLD